MALRFAGRFAGLGSVVERSATKAAIAQASLSAARRGARSNVAHIAPPKKQRPDPNGDF